MKRIIHISDVHVGYSDLSDRFHQFVNNLTKGVKGNPSEFIIVISGDLVDKANDPKNYREIKKRLVDLKEAGFKDILIIPGNHDYGTGSRGNKKYVRLFKQSFFNENRDYPLVDIIDRVAFIGLDSMAEELHWYDRIWAQGELGKKQLNRLSNILKNDEVVTCKKRVIYLHHHPFDQRPLHQLKDTNKLHDVLMNTVNDEISIDAILYGHNHEGKSNNGLWSIPRCYDAGSITLKPRSKLKKDLPRFGEVRNSTRVIDLGDNPNVDYILNLSII